MRKLFQSIDANFDTTSIDRLFVWPSVNVYLNPYLSKIAHVAWRAVSSRTITRRCCIPGAIRTFKSTWVHHKFQDATLVEVPGLWDTLILVTSVSRYQRRGELISNKIGILTGMYTHFCFRTAFASQYRTASSQRLPSFGSSPSPGRLRLRRWISGRQPASYAPLQNRKHCVSEQLRRMWSINPTYLLLHRPCKLSTILSNRRLEMKKKLSNVRQYALGLMICLRTPRRMTSSPDLTTSVSAQSNAVVVGFTSASTMTTTTFLQLIFCSNPFLVDSGLGAAKFSAGSCKDEGCGSLYAFTLPLVEIIDCSWRIIVHLG